MDIFEAISGRHSYRGGFVNSPVSRDLLKKIVQAGLDAPSGCNAQTTSFVIVDDSSVISSIAGIIDKQVVREAKAIIVCLVEHRIVYANESFGVEDCSAAVENMLLAITAVGLATVWLDGVLRSDGRAKRIAGLLGVPENLEVRVVLPVGFPAQECRGREKLPFKERVWFNRFRSTEDAK